MSKMRLVGSTALSALTGFGLAASVNAATVQDGLNYIQSISPGALQEALITVVHDNPTSANLFFEQARARGMNCTTPNINSSMSYGDIRSAVSSACAGTDISMISEAVSGGQVGFSGATITSATGSSASFGGAEVIERSSIGRTIGGKGYGAERAQIISSEIIDSDVASLGEIQTERGSLSGSSFGTTTTTSLATTTTSGSAVSFSEGQTTIATGESKTPYNGPLQVVRTTTDERGGRTYTRSLGSETVMVPQEAKIITKTIQPQPQQVVTQTLVQQPSLQPVSTQIIEAAAPQVVEATEAVTRTATSTNWKPWALGGAAAAGGVGLLAFLLNKDDAEPQVITRVISSTPEPTPTPAATPEPTPEPEPTSEPTTTSTVDRNATAHQGLSPSYTPVPFTTERTFSAADPLAYLNSCDCNACAQAQAMISNGVSLSYSHAGGHSGAMQSFSDIDDLELAWQMGTTMSGAVQFDTSAESALGFASDRKGGSLFGDHDSGLSGLGLVDLDAVSVEFDMGDKASLRVTTLQGGDADQVTGGFITQSYAANDNLDFKFGIGAIESDGLLGLDFTDGYGIEGSQSGVLTGQVRYAAADDLEIVGIASVAKTGVNLSTDSSIVDASSITSMGGSLSLVKHTKQAPVDYVSLGLTVPSKIVSGSVTTSQGLGFSGYNHDMGQTGTELRFDAVTAKSLNDTLHLVAGASYRMNPDHDASAKDEVGFKFGLGMKF